MSSEKSLTPKIRFKGFTEAWEQRKLGDYCEMFNGDRSAKYPGAQDMVSEGIPFINAGDLEYGHVNLAAANKITREKYDDLGGAKLQIGDIVYCLRGTLGKNAYIDNFAEGTVASSLVAIRPKNINGRYLFHVLNSDIEYCQRIVHDEGAAQPNLSAKSVSEFTMPVPDIDEQKKISKFLDNLSNLITLHQRKLDALKKIKSALLEKMFPKNGSNVPEIRFTGFTEAWEQRKLGDYGFVQMCRRIYKDQTSEIGDVPFYKIGTFGSQPDAFISKSLFQDYRKKYPFPSAGTPLISAAGSIGRTVVYQGEEAYFQDSNIVWLDNNEKLNNVFLNSLYKKIDWKLEGSTIKRLYNKDILNAEVCVPSTIEQCQVGLFFARLDSLITLHQRKLDALKKIKSALLEKMFV